MIAPSRRETITEAAHRIRRESRARQGLPPCIEDPAVLHRIATLMRPAADPKSSTPATSPGRGRPADTPNSPLGQSPRDPVPHAPAACEPGPTSPEAA